MNIEVSLGEIVDKYSILELKKKYIKDVNKLNEIEKELNILEKYTYDIKQTDFYKQLLYINEQIWVDTDKIKKIDFKLLINSLEYSTNVSYLELANKIFENNQKRFRLKNYFNILDNSNIKECKSYSNNNCFILINDEKDIYLKKPEIAYLCISYDYVYISSNYKHIISKLFKNPNIKYTDDTECIYNISNYDLLVYNIDNNLKDIFDFDTIKI
jgi:hypothetical protein